MAVGGKRAHLQLLGDREGFTLIVLGLLRVLAANGDIALCLTMITPCAHAQSPSDEEITSHLKEQYEGLNVVDYKRIFAVRIDKPADEIVVVSYSISYPTKDPLRSTELEVFTTKNGWLTAVPMSALPIGQVQDVSVRDSRIFVETKTFRESDRPCCPTDSHSFVFTPSDGVLIGTMK